MAALKRDNVRVFFIHVSSSLGRKAARGAALAWLIVRSAHLAFFATACPGERFRQKQFIENLKICSVLFFENYVWTSEQNVKLQNSDL